MSSSVDRKGKISGIGTLKPALSVFVWLSSCRLCGWPVAGSEPTASCSRWCYSYGKVCVRRATMAFLLSRQGGRNRTACRESFLALTSPETGRKLSGQRKTAHDQANKKKVWVNACRAGASVIFLL